jgi:hypothetical protein
MCVSTARIWPCAALPAQRVLSVLPNSEAVLPLLCQNLLSGEGAALTRRDVATAHCCSACLGTPVAGHHHSRARGAVMGLHAACLRTEHSDAPPSDQTGLPWCQPTYPMCQWQAILLTWAHPAHLPAFNVIIGLESRGGPSATGTWQGQPRSCRGGGTWQHRTPSRREGGPGPRGRSERSGPWRSGPLTWWPWTSLGSPGPWGPPESTPALMGT